MQDEMKWSVKLGQLFGIDVYMHLTFLLLLAWVGVRYYLPERDLAAAVSGILFILVLFGIVVLHELGHALTARRFGIRTRDITLLPIGGVARLERMPEEPRQELIVALAGPAVNVGLAGVIALCMLAATGTDPLGEVSFAGSDFLRNLLWVNVALAVFNMIPAFPMDGGRVLRALLAMRLDYVKATRIAASIGQSLAFAFGFFGLFTNPFLVLIAVFVWMGAGAEAGMVEMKSSLAGLAVSRGMITDFRTLEMGDPLRRAVDHVLAGFQHDFPVVDGSRPVGMLTRDALIKAIAQAGLDAPVSAFMAREFETADPSEPLEPALARLRDSACPALPVVRDGELVGVLTVENVSELLMVRAAVRAGAASA
jgi:Zn-dependent protease/CBS domain-containing protein